MTLLLDSLRIEDYRLFRRLQIERLGRANLFVGRNNAGKSSLLEAVRLFASRGNEAVLFSILESHDETRIAASEQLEDRLYAVKQLFHGRDNEWTERSEIRIGSVRNLRDRLTIRIGAVSSRGQDFLPFDLRQPALFESSTDDEPRRFVIATAIGESVRNIPLDVEWRRWNSLAQLRATEATPRQAYVPPQGLTAEAAARLWDLIALTDLEENVIEALRIISPEIERISFIGERGLARIPVAKLATQVKPVPLRSLGDGVSRMLGIALSLVSARGGVLLLDEVENGIHFTAQAQLWQLIFRSAHRLKTQVFATSHSWDCIEAFQHAAALDPHEEAALIRLDVHSDAISPTTFSERELSIVTRDKIEVR